VYINISGAAEEGGKTPISEFSNIFSASKLGKSQMADGIVPEMLL